LLSPSIIKNGLLGTLISNACFIGVFLLIFIFFNNVRTSSQVTNNYTICSL
jgi:hypothetical protein